MVFSRRNIFVFFCIAACTAILYFSFSISTSPTISPQHNTLVHYSETKVSQHTVDAPADNQQPQIIANQLPATLQDSKQTLEDIAKQAASTPANTPDLTPPSGDTPAQITAAANKLIQELAASGVDIKHSKASFSKQWQATQLNPELEQQDTELATELQDIKERIAKLQQPNQ
jgi:hypothetical protein